jgi:hypothetical protein
MLVVEIAKESERKGLRADGQQQSCRLVVSLPARAIGTNRMSELLTYGSVGGVGRKRGPYPAGNVGIAS